ncbi:hypothetical protein HB779_14170 [Phyllobacterium sp. 628]|uniref:hypothetical protein n=1 Tax=Phyllobacterium sp. 628 TaxID=2718938 RepID=UPI00166256F0|nr:hypothetical protein [Phyllobacterium sp. 628]QND52919.1 hypothetical protein HB779_14170 [Phyllobacterium sp. 628]
MASTDFSTARNAPATGFRRTLSERKDRAAIVVVFTAAFAFHLAVLFNLLPA